VAQKPDGKAAKAERVTFTRLAAERIAKAVRKVEQGDRGAEALRFDRLGISSQQKIFRVCTFTGAWSINTFKSVTFVNVTSTPNTVSAYNVFLNVNNLSGGTAHCAIARDGTAWYMIAAVC
jgi:hypothetical protein